MAGASITPGALARRFLAAPAKFEACLARELKRVGMKVRDTAVRKFGIYQGAVGPFPAWANLAEYTLEQKFEAGAKSDDPLIGHYPKGHKNTVWPAPLRTTIEVHVRQFEVEVGTRDPLGKIHEFGTEDGHIPPRPFLRPAAFENEAYARERWAIATEEAILLL